MGRRDLNKTVAKPARSQIRKRLKNQRSPSVPSLRSNVLPPRLLVAVDIGDARSPAFLKSLSAKHMLMLVFYQVWLANCWVLGRFVNARFANYWTRLMARMMRCPAQPDSIHWTMNYPYAMTWFGLGGGLRSLTNFKPHCPVLYLYGQRKPFMFHSQQWLDRLNAAPGSKTKGFQAGHWVMLDKPQEFVAVVRVWLAN